MDFLVGSGIAALTIYAAANWKSGDEKKMKYIFRNVGYKVKGYEPKLIRKEPKHNYTDYIYSVPYGLIDDPKLQPILEATLCRPVQVSFRGKLIIRVFKEDLAKRIDYNWLPTKGWTVPLGFTLNNKVSHNFDSIPHMTVAGMTRNGKTVLLKLILAHLIISNPDDVNFYIIDLKGGLEFGPYENLKQVKRVASNVKEAESLLKEVSKNIKTDMKYFREKGYRNILDTNIKKRTFIIVDEGAELAPARHHSKEEKKMFSYCQYVLGEITRISGALGYRNIFCTQYPTADNLPRNVKQNSDGKISFRLPTEVASRVAIDEQGAERLSNVGRAIYKTHEKEIMQALFICDIDMEEKLRGHVNDSGKKKNTTSRKNIIEFS